MEAPAHRPAEAAQLLGIPASTLRRWSGQFADFLSSARREPGDGGHRRYTPADLQVLSEVKQMLGRGMTYQQVRARLAQQAGETAQGTTTEVLAAESAPSAPFAIERAAVPLPMDDEPGTSVGDLLTNTLYSLSDSQQIILSNQQTSRQLLGVLLQDNFNLKEENSKLRERMLETERKLFELKHDLDEGQARERERMRQMEQYLFDLQRRLDGLTSPSVRPAPSPPVAAPPPAPPPADLAPPSEATALPPTKKPGLWERLWGGKR